MSGQEADVVTSEVEIQTSEELRSFSPCFIASACSCMFCMISNMFTPQISLRIIKDKS